MGDDDLNLSSVNCQQMLLKDPNHQLLFICSLPCQSFSALHQRVPTEDVDLQITDSFI